MQADDDFEYAIFILERIYKLEKDIEDPPSKTEISRERRNSEVQACKKWFKTGKGMPTTGDKAIKKYYPLPEKPPNKPINKPIERKKNPARMMVKQVKKWYPDVHNCRRAWNLLPEVLDQEMLLEHVPIPDKNNQLTRKSATATINNAVQRVTITFKAFENGWYREQEDPEKRREAIAKRKLKEEMDRMYNRKWKDPK